MAGALLAGCLKIERRSSQVPGFPQQLLGEWHGSWRSSSTAGSGQLVLAVQAFQGQPIVTVDLQHPCIVGQGYQFVQQGLRWELRLNEQTVFTAEVELANRTLNGSYDCQQDQGSWSASWDHALPEIPDLSGIWSGVYEALQPPSSGILSMELLQNWQDGRLRLTGSLSFDGHGVTLPLIVGEVAWTGDLFELLVQGGVPPSSVNLQGSGQRIALAVSQGLFTVEDPRLPFRFGIWNAAWLPP